MTKDEFIKATINGYEGVAGANEALAEARQQMAEAWQDYLNSGQGNPRPVLKERILALYDDRFYEIELDLVDFSVPTVKRVDNYVEYYEVVN